MSQIGSFALLLALALCAYSFLAGLLALVIQGPGSERLGETARRAGIASFAIVFLAAVVLVVAAFRLRTRPQAALQNRRSPLCLRFGHHCGRAGLLLIAAELRGQSLRSNA